MLKHFLKGVKKYDIVEKKLIGGMYMKRTLLMLLGAIILTYFTFILPFSEIYNSGLFEVLSFWLILIFVFSYNYKNYS